MLPIIAKNDNKNGASAYGSPSFALSESGNAAALARNYIKLI